MIFITGCAGFVGSNLINSYDRDVWGCDSLEFGYKESVKVNTWSKCDMDGISEYFLRNFDIMVHLATANIQFAADNHIKTFNINAHKTIELFKRFNGKIIYTSTASVYGNNLMLPTREKDDINLRGAYDMSKYIVENYLRLRGNYTTLRLSNVYGNIDTFRQYPNVVEKFTRSDVIEITGDGKDTRDFTHISDVIAAIKAAIALPAFNTEINISSGVETSINELAEMFGKPIIHIPERSIDGINRRWLDNTRAKELLNWTPKVVLKDYIQSVKE
jgi:UDP-glucose 4-epimerase